MQQLTRSHDQAVVWFWLESQVGGVRPASGRAIRGEKGDSRSAMAVIPPNLRDLRRLWLGRRIAAGTLLLNFGAAVASFISTTILARMAGAEILGHYALATMTINVLAVLALLGQDRIIMRTIAGDLRQGLKTHAHGALIRVRRSVGWSAILISILYLVGFFHFPFLGQLDTDPNAMLLVGFGVTVVALMRLGIAALRGAGHQLGAQALDGFATFAFCLILTGFVITNVAPTSAQALLLFVGMQALAAAIAWWLLAHDTARWGAPAHDPALRLVVAGIPLMLVTFVHLTADWLLVSMIARHENAASVGAFRVAAQIISIPALVVATAETYYSPWFAGDFRAARPDLAWRRQRRANKTVIIATAPLLVLILLFAEPLLGGIFGPEFAVAAPALQIMVFGQLLNVLTGPIGGMLAMSGRERSLLLLAVCGMVALFTLGSVLVPLIGLKGAAIAWSANILIRSGGAYIIGHRGIPKHAA